MTDRPTCNVCGHRVSLTSDADGRFSCWCWCANASKHDRNYRAPGVGDTEAEAVVAWEKTRRPS